MPVIYKDYLEGWLETRLHLVWFYPLSWLTGLNVQARYPTSCSSFLPFCTILIILYTSPFGLQFSVFYLHTLVSHGLISRPSYLHLAWWDELFVLNLMTNSLKLSKRWKEKPADPTTEEAREFDIGKINSWLANFVDPTIDVHLANFGHSYAFPSFCVPSIRRISIDNLPILGIATK